MANILKTNFSSLNDAAQYLENEKFEQVFGDTKLYWVSDDGLINAEVHADDESQSVIVEYIG